MPEANIRQPLCGAAARRARDLLLEAAEPSALATAIRVGQDMLAAYGSTDYADPAAVAQALGATRESLRILLRALGAETDPAKGTQIVSTPGGDQQLSPIGGSRCPAAHPEDPTPCDGPVAVTVLDRENAGADGCEHHAARLLASLEGGRVYPLPDAPEGAAIRVFKAADDIRPFCWYEDAPRTRPETLSRKENREAGEGQ